MMEISKDVKEIINKADYELKNIYRDVDVIEEYNSQKVLNAFIECNVTEDCFNMTTGYGYNDLGRDTIEKVYSKIFKSEVKNIINEQNQKQSNPPTTPKIF